MRLLLHNHQGSSGRRPRREAQPRAAHTPLLEGLPRRPPHTARPIATHRLRILQRSAGLAPTRPEHRVSPEPSCSPYPPRPKRRPPGPESRPPLPPHPPSFPAPSPNANSPGAAPRRSARAPPAPAAVTQPEPRASQDRWLRTAPSRGQAGRDNAAVRTAGPARYVAIGTTEPHTARPRPRGGGTPPGAPDPEKGRPGAAPESEGRGRTAGERRPWRREGRRPSGPPAGPGHSAPRGRPRLARRQGPAPRPAVTCAAGGCCPRSSAQDPAAAAAPGPGAGCADGGGWARGLRSPLQASKPRMDGAAGPAPGRQAARGGATVAGGSRTRAGPQLWRRQQLPEMAPAASGYWRARARHGGAQRPAQGLSREAATRRASPGPASRETSRPEAAAAQTLARLGQTGGVACHAPPGSRESSRAHPGCGGKVRGERWGPAIAGGGAARPLPCRGRRTASSRPGLGPAAFMGTAPPSAELCPADLGPPFLCGLGNSPRPPAPSWGPETSPPVGGALSRPLAFWQACSKSSPPRVSSCRLPQPVSWGLVQVRCICYGKLFFSSVLEHHQLFYSLSAPKAVLALQMLIALHSYCNNKSVSIYLSCADRLCPNFFPHLLHQ